MIKPYTKAMQTGRQTITSDEFKASNDSEQALQRQCEEMLKYHPDIAVIRVPDAAYKAIFANQTIPSWVRALIARFLKGLPDLILLRADGETYCKAVCVELKTKKGKQTQGQKKFARIVPVHVCRSLEHFEQIVKDFRCE